MEEAAFEKLSEGFDFLCEFYQYWLTEEEAKFLLSVPSLPTSIDSIAEKSGVRMPSFFGYMVYSCLILLPLLVVTTAIFF